MSAICRILAAALAVSVLVSCEEDLPGSSNTDAVPDIMADRREACEKDGGRWAPTANGVVFICFRNLSDANKQCRKETDCQGYCLARSQTCSPIEPLLGCHEILSPSGLPQTICLE